MLHNHYFALKNNLFLVLSIFFIIFHSFILLPTNALSKKYIVSATTNSKNWESAEWILFPDTPRCTPCTPQSAMKNAKPGDTIYFRGGEGGNYDLYPKKHWSVPELNPTYSGQIGNPITFTAYPGEIPVLKNKNIDCQKTSDGCAYPLIGSQGKDFIIWDGFQLGLTMNKKNEGNPTIRFENCKNCELINSYIYIVSNYDDLYKSNYMGIYLKNCINTNIKNNFITGGNLMGEKKGQSFSSAILMYTCSNTIIENTTIMNTGNGIGDKSLGRNNIYRNNFLSNTGTYGLWFGGASGNKSSARGNKAYQNIIVLNNKYARGIKIDNDSTGTSHGDAFDIYNNVIYAPEKAKIAIHAENPTNDRYWNNIISGVFTYATLLMDGPNGNPKYIDFNAYNGNQKFVMKRHEPDKVIYHSFKEWREKGQLADGKRPENKSFYEDSGFINPTVHNPNGFKLSKHSLCRQAGKNGEHIGAYPKDNSRPIGCSLSGIYPLLPPKDLMIVKD